MSVLNEEFKRLAIPRHLQDFNGYCGPACALMLVDFAGSAKSPPVYAQNELFREVRGHASAHRDRRPIKSPAESLLAVVNDHTIDDWKWTKVFDPDPLPVAEQVFWSIEQKQQPCLILVSEGMHWVVAFGLLKNDEGNPSGLLMRDPAWTGMPRFYGLSVFPEKPRIEHRISDCPCMKSDGENSPGTVHERFFTVDELLSHRGLQGAPDHEGEGAIALVPPGEVVVPMVLGKAGVVMAPVSDAYAKAGEAALKAVKEVGLVGRPDSPSEWNTALSGATAGEPVLVRHPTDERDDFFLVPLNPADPTATLGAWAMLDAKTLALREVSLLKDWKMPAFPDPDKDVQQLSQAPLTLSGGVAHKYPPSEIQPNLKNLVWKPSAASILPYWPVKEFTVAHPRTGNSESVYLSQEGVVYPDLSPHELPEEKSADFDSPKKAFGPLAKGALGAAVVAAGIYLGRQFPGNPSEPSRESPPEDVVNSEESFENTSPDRGERKPKEEPVEEPDEFLKAFSDGDRSRPPIIILEMEEEEPSGSQRRDPGEESKPGEPKSAKKGEGIPVPPPSLVELENEMSGLRDGIPEKSDVNDVARINEKDSRKEGQKGSSTVQGEGEQGGSRNNLSGNGRDGSSVNDDPTEAILREIQDLKKKGYGEKHPRIVELNREMAKLRKIPPRTDHKGLQAEREKLHAILHHAPEGMDLRKYQARLQQIEELLKKSPPPKQ